MREAEKEAEKEEDTDACFRGCCRVLKTTKRETCDDDEINAFPRMTFRLAKDLVNVNAMMTSIMGSSFENSTTTTSNTTTTTNKAGKKNQQNKLSLIHI